MEENYLIKMGEDIKSLIPGNPAIYNNNDTISIVIDNMEAGVKGINVNIECSASTVKIKGARKYKYPMNEASIEEFQKKILDKYQGYGIYVSGQTLSFSKFFSYQSEAEAVDVVRSTLEVIRDTVVIFEETCVNFLDKNTETEQEEYDPEKNVNLINVDNNYHAVITTEQDNTSYKEEHINFTEEVFDKLLAKLGGTKHNNEFVIHDDQSGKTIRCVLFAEEAEIMVSISIPAPGDVGAMYSSYIHANYPEIMSTYNTEEEVFTVRGYASPDKYAPEETENFLKMCDTAIDACVQTYTQTLEKKDSTDFASDLQKLLNEQSEGVIEREKTVSAREEEIAAKEEEMKARERELQDRIQQLEQEKDEIQNEKLRLQEREANMKNEIKEYEDRNTQDILKLKQLANQVSLLQNRQNSLGQGDDKAEEEIFRLTSKVKQMTSQKIALEKKLTEKIVNRESHIRQLSDVISQKDTEIRKLKTHVDDMVQSRVTEEVQKTTEHVQQLEKKVSEIGHILTPEDFIRYLRQFDDMEVKKFHAPNAKFVVYNDESLEIRVRFGVTNYVDVSKVATLKDQIIRKLNTKYGDVKFFSKDNRIIARTYFHKNATAKEVEEVIESLSAHFAK